MQFERLTSDEAEAVLKKSPIALIPLGAIENHGNHLPLSTDNDLATALVKKVAAKLDNVIVMPPIYYGQVWSTSGYPGTISLSTETLRGMLVDIGSSLFSQGVKTFAMINTHMGNLDGIKFAARQLYDELGMKVLYLTYPGIEHISAKVLQSKRVHHTYFHACELETSYMLYLAPEKVDMTKAICNDPELPPDFDVTLTPWRHITDSPVLGDATLATREKGEVIIETAVDHMVRIIEHARKDQENIRPKRSNCRRNHNCRLLTGGLADD